MGICQSSVEGFLGSGLRVPLGLRVGGFRALGIWVVVKTRVLCWVPNMIRHLLFRVPKKGP